MSFYLQNVLPIKQSTWQKKNLRRFARSARSAFGLTRAALDETFCDFQIHCASIIIEGQSQMFHHIQNEEGSEGSNGRTKQNRSEARRALVRVNALL